MNTDHLLLYKDLNRLPTPLETDANLKYLEGRDNAVLDAANTAIEAAEAAQTATEQARADAQQSAEDASTSAAQALAAKTTAQQTADTVADTIASMGSIQVDLANAGDPAKGAALVGYAGSTVKAVLDSRGTRLTTAESRLDSNDTHSITVDSHLTTLDASVAALQAGTGVRPVLSTNLLKVLNANGAGVQMVASTAGDTTLSTDPSGTGTFTARYVIKADGTQYPSGDATQTLGQAANRYSTVYSRNVTLSLPSSVTPVNNGDVSFELTSNTRFAVKAKGSDGTVRGMTMPLGGALSTWTPAVASSAGTMTSANGTGSWYQIDKLVFFTLTANVVTNGTGSGTVQVSLPQVAANVLQYCSGRETFNTGKQVLGEIPANSGTIFIKFYDNTYPGANSASITISGCYLAASV